MHWPIYVASRQRLQAYELADTTTPTYTSLPGQPEKVCAHSTAAPTHIRIAHFRVYLHRVLLQTWQVLLVYVVCKAKESPSVVVHVFSYDLQQLQGILQ